MWILNCSVPCIIHLNFRSERHAEPAERWLGAKGFALNQTIRSTLSSGVPNGPYAGPVYSKAFGAGTIELMGANTWEGVYFAFVETGAGPGAAAAREGEEEDVVEDVAVDVHV